MILRAFLPLLLLHLVALPSGAADKRFLAFGDSITTGHGDTGVLCPDNTSVGGYPPRLRSRLAAQGIDAEFLNFGLCGEDATEGVTRIDSVLEEGGDVIVIMEATNDISGGTGVETILFSLNEMARKADLAGIEPLLVSAIPRGPDSGRDSNNVRTRAVADQLRIDAAAAGWAFADGFYAFFDLPDFFERFYFDQLHPDPGGYDILADSIVDAAVDAATREDLCRQVPPGSCAPSDTVLCLNGGRFRIDIVWEGHAGQTGVAHAVPQTDDTGAFYWVDPENIEVAIKVLDGRTNNGHFWVFYGALSNFKFSVVVTDTETGECREYPNPLGTFASVGDTAAFPDPPIEPLP